jgi:hypothetical protein
VRAFRAVKKVDFILGGIQKVGATIFFGCAISD